MAPVEAKTVRTIFALYLEADSVAALADILKRKGIRTKIRPLLNGESKGGISFGVGPLAHLLRNRFYIGEIAYRGEIHAGEHEAILDRHLFERVQAKLNKNVVDRAMRLKGSPALLMGRIFDDVGNRMTPSHSNKDGVRYRYYVSQAVIQGRRRQAGTVRRVPAAKIEDLVLGAVRQNLASRDPENIASDQSAVIARIQQIIVKREAVEIEFLETETTLTNTSSESRRVRKLHQQTQAQLRYLGPPQSDKPPRSHQIHILRTLRAAIEDFGADQGRRSATHRKLGAAVRPRNS